MSTVETFCKANYVHCGSDRRPAVNGHYGSYRRPNVNGHYGSYRRPAVDGDYSSYRRPAVNGHYASPLSVTRPLTTGINSCLD